MELDRDSSNTEECLVTALQIFDYCGADSTGTLHVDALMDKCAPSVKNNNAEFSYLKSMLDPNKSNPEISVSRLANALNMFSDRNKLDLDESFNLKSGSGPQDSDSGISNDGFLILEELQSELREKSHLAAQLRSQLDFTDRQHEETLAAITAERDSLRTHLTMLRDENMTLMHARRDYEEASERLCASEQALATARRERDAARRRAATLQDQVAELDAEKLTLQELLTKSKDECHRINEMYASRQSSLLEQNELLKTGHAELSSRLQDQEDLTQQMLKEKVILEMELKDMLNRSNQTQQRFDRSIDVSYTEDQMLTALDSLNADSRFSTDNHVLDEDAFVKALKEREIGRASNLSLFDEIRLSFCNMSRRDIPDSFCNLSKSQLLDFNEDCDKCSSQLDSSTTNIGTQTDDGINDDCNNSNKICPNCEKYKDDMENLQCNLKLSNEEMTILQTELNRCKENLNNIDRFKTDTNNSWTQTKDYIKTCSKCIEKTIEYDKLKDYNATLKTELNNAQNKLVDMEKIMFEFETNFKTLEKYVDSIKQERDEAKKQIEAMMADVPLINKPVQVIDDTKVCTDCDKLKEYTTKLEHDVVNAKNNVSKMVLDLNQYENALDVLQKYVDEGIDRNNFLEALSDNLQAKLEILESACEAQRVKLDGLSCESCSAQCQTDSDVASISTQVEVPCLECEKRNAIVPHRSLRKLLWDPLKCLFQAFAVLCFICAISVLYGVTRRNLRCDREAVPWRWLDAQEFLDFLLRIEYVADVPM